MANNNTRVYHFWNGKNLNGHSVVGDPSLITEQDRDNMSQAEMKYEVGVDTFSADDLQRDVSYDE